MLELMMDILFRVSLSDAALNAYEENMLQSAARIFGFAGARYQQIKSKYVRDVDKYYTILGCTRSDSIDTIKKQYRKLASDYHPDKIIAKGLPEEFVKFANDKFKEIQEAYDAIKKEKGII
jgi:DnaJ like chaperone protein